MPLTHFVCPPDKEKIALAECFRMCRLGQRCATLAYLKLVGYERPWKGVTPSMAGNGPRLEWLKLTTDYAVNPHSRAFAALGTGVHGKLGLSVYTDNVLSEEPLDSGTPDCLECDEDPEYFILTDYKTWGSFKVRMSIGMVKKSKDIPILDDDGNGVLLKSGPNKGKPKTKKNTWWEIDPAKIDIKDTALQLNRYRIGFERLGFPISRIQVQAIVRDGGIRAATSNGTDRNVYLIQIPRMSDTEVLDYYDNLAREINYPQRRSKSQGSYRRKCNLWESWDGRRCNRWCDVSQACEEMGI